MEFKKQKLSFLKVIEQDRYDELTRRVFADWLEEYGYDDEALVQRSWTKEKQQAEDWLREFVIKINLAPDDLWTKEEILRRPEISYEDVIQAGYCYLRDGSYFVQVGSEEASNMMDNDAIREQFWKNWELVTSENVSEEARQATVFSCSC